MGNSTLCIGVLVLLGFACSFSNCTESVTTITRDQLLSMWPKNVGSSSRMAFLGMPPLVGMMWIGGDVTSWDSDPCFKTTKAIVYQSENSVLANFSFSGSKSVLRCKANYLIACGPMFVVAQFENANTNTWYSVVVANKTTDMDKAIINLNGVGAFILPGSIVELFEDILATIELFTSYNETIVMNFLDYYMDIPAVPRTPSTLDTSYMKSGDVIVTWRTSSGIDALDMFGTGGYASHSAIVLEIDGEKYVVEAINPYNLATPVDKWMEDDGYNPRAILRMGPEFLARYDNEKAVQRWKELEGLYYGYSTFMYGWIDTIDQNYPPPLSGPFTNWLMYIVDQFLGPIFDMIVGAALNQRIDNPTCCIRGTKCTTDQPPCLTYINILNTITEQGISMLDLIAIPEKEEWEYCIEEKCGPSRVCSALVTDILKHAGVFQGIDFYPSEFVPRDVYQMNIYDTAKPEGCESLDPDLPYCQVGGDLKLYLPGWNSVPLYDHMNERCGALPKDYVRAPDDC
ncbi:zinc finger protein, MYND-type [Pelomyxa schiedti]|nr:zinc finger protein, MYND-type [Pelomyxa schiedti]